MDMVEGDNYSCYNCKRANARRYYVEGIANMTVNVYDTANQLERELRETDAYKTLQEAFQTIQNDEEASPLFQEFRNIQVSLQQKQMSGEGISEEEVQKAQELSVKVGENEAITKLMEAEKHFSTVIDDLNQIILKPVRDLYQS